MEDKEPVGLDAARLAVKLLQLGEQIQARRGAADDTYAAESAGSQAIVPLASAALMRVEELLAAEPRAHVLVSMHDEVAWQLRATLARHDADALGGAVGDLVEAVEVVTVMEEMPVLVVEVVVDQQLMLQQQVQQTLEAVLEV